MNNNNTEGQTGLNQNLSKKHNSTPENLEENLPSLENYKISIEFSKTISSLKEEIYGPHIQHKNFTSLYTNIMEIFNTFQKNRDKESYDVIFKEILPFLERHIQRFKIEQMIRMVCALAENNIGHLQYFRIFQYYIGKALEREKNHMSIEKEEFV